jgi:hypothetical protein
VDSNPKTSGSKVNALPTSTKGCFQNGSTALGNKGVDFFARLGSSLAVWPVTSHFND